MDTTTRKKSRLMLMSFLDLTMEKLSFMTGNFENVNQLSGTIKQTVGLRIFSFREIKCTGRYEIIFAKYEGIPFPSEEKPSIMGFCGIPDGRGVHIGYKMDRVK